MSDGPDGAVTITPIGGLPEFRPGDDLGAAILTAAPWITDGDVIAVTSKIVSKVEGRLVPSPTDPAERDAFRRRLIDQETVRVVARHGRTLIVENSLGIVAAAAGIDASNVRTDEIALLPVDPGRVRRAVACEPPSVRTDSRGAGHRHPGAGPGATVWSTSRSAPPGWRCSRTSAAAPTRTATNWW